MPADHFHRSRFRQVEDDLLCCLCNLVPRSPLMAPCQHVCCSSCAHGWTTCPQCGAVGEFTRPGRIVQGVYDRLEVRCEHASRGCDFAVPFSRLQDLDLHATRCAKAPSPCSHEGCPVMEARDLITDHEAVCEHRTVNCDLCNTAVKAKALAAHKASSCPLAEAECSCGQSLRRRDMDLHAARCPHRVPVVCPVVGCGRSVPQGDLEAHLAGTLTQHLQLVSVAIQEREGAISRLADEVRAARQKLGATEAKVAALEAERRDLAWYGMGLWRREQDGRNVWTIGNMNQKLKEVSLKQLTPVRMPLLFWSPQYYTHSSGYRFSLRLDLGSSANVGLYVHLHEGDNDDRLPWPFNLDYTVQVGAMTSQITQRESYMHYTSQGRPPHELSWGWANFCSLEAFRQAIHRDSVEVAISFHSGPLPGAVAPSVATQPYGANGSAAMYPLEALGGRHPLAPMAGYGPLPPSY